MDQVEETIIKPVGPDAAPPVEIPADEVDVNARRVTNYGVDPELRRRQVGLLDNLEKSTKEQADLADKRSAALRPEYARQLDNLNRPRPELKLQETPEAPDTRAHDKEAMQSYFFPMLAFAALLSKAAGADMATGLNMLSQGIMGMKMGRDEMANQSIEQWKNKMQSVKEKNAALLDQYNAVMKDRSMSAQEQQMRIGLIAAQHGDAMMSAQIKEKGILGALKAIDEMQKRNEKADALNEKIEQTIIASQERMDLEKFKAESREKIEVMRETARKELQEMKSATSREIAAMRAKGSVAPEKRWEHYRKDLESLKKWRANALLGIDKALMTQEGKQQAAAFVDQEYLAHIQDLAKTYAEFDVDEGSGTAAQAPEMGKTEGGWWPWSKPEGPAPSSPAWSATPKK